MPTTRRFPPSDLPAPPPDPQPRAQDAAFTEPPSRFDIAAARARARYSAEEWVLLDPGKRSTAIYAELRRIDGAFSR
jgi:hypothetical protein